MTITNTPAQDKRKAKRKPPPPPVHAGRNSFTMEELMFRNHWSRNFVYSLIARGILRTYKDGKRRRATAAAEAEAIARLEAATAEGEAV